MNPYWIVGCGILQLVILYSISPWMAGFGAGFVLLLILMLLAVTRLRWDSHLDMILVMTGPGGLGMLLPMLVVNGPACHIQASVTGFLWMTAGMLLLAVPQSWQSARCLVEARLQGVGALTLTADLVGMQAGMLLGHLAMSKWPMGDTRLIWMHHASMLVCMLLGMLAGMLVLRRTNLKRATNP